MRFEILWSLLRADFQTGRGLCRLGGKGTGCGDIAFGETEIGVECDLVVRSVDVKIMLLQPGDSEDYWVLSELSVAEYQNFFMRFDSES